MKSKLIVAVMAVMAVLFIGAFLSSIAGIWTDDERFIETAIVFALSGLAVLWVNIMIGLSTSRYDD